MPKWILGLTNLLRWFNLWRNLVLLSWGSPKRSNSESSSKQLGLTYLYTVLSHFPMILHIEFCSFFGFTIALDMTGPRTGFFFWRWVLDFEPTMVRTCRMHFTGLWWERSLLNFPLDLPHEFFNLGLRRTTKLAEGKMGHAKNYGFVLNRNSRGYWFSGWWFGTWILWLPIYWE